MKDVTVGNVWKGRAEPASEESPKRLGVDGQAN